jgi:branched-chain amino acid transport system permease protein
VKSRWPSARPSAALGAVAATVLVTVLLLLCGGLFSPATVSLIVTLSILFGLAQAWNIIAGFGGQVSLAVGGFVGVGAYASTYSMIHFGIGAIPAIGFAVVAAAIIATVIAYPVFRLRGNYFTIGTLTLALAIQALVLNWNALGASAGISVPTNSLPTQIGLFRLAVITSAVIMLCATFVRFSDFGLRLMAVRDHEAAARSLGVAAFRAKTVILILSSMLIAAVGCLLAFQQFTIEPNSAFSLTWTVGAVVMCVVGGLGTVLGPLLGTILVYYGIQDQLQSSAALSTIVTGAALLVVIRFAPEGVWPLTVRVTRAGWRHRNGRIPKEATLPAVPDELRLPLPEKAEQ